MSIFNLLKSDEKCQDSSYLKKILTFKLLFGMFFANLFELSCEQIYHSLTKQITQYIARNLI